MPIRFRCDYCNRLLGIARRKAGTETTCPHCGYAITVPQAPADDDLYDVELLLNPAGLPPVVTPPVPAVATRPTPPPRPTLVESAGGERPLFEKGLEAVLGESKEAKEQAAGGPKPPTGTDARSLGPDDGQVVLSSQKATVIAVAMVVLLALAFAAGFLMASR